MNVIDYFALDRLVASAFDFDVPLSSIPDLPLDIATFPFTSAAAWLLPGADDYPDGANARFGDDAALKGPRFAPRADPLLGAPDRAAVENARFRCAVLVPRGAPPARRAVALLHGLNEKTWEKYYAWGARLALDLRRPVVLFPIAFHMNRTPAQWNSPRAMNAVAKERRALSPTLAAGSFANAAISVRLQAIPQRFFFSCMETVHDLRAFAALVRAGGVPGLAADCALDFFAYSVGAFLAETLLLGDEARVFGAARALLFCGGATFDLMDPVSKFILDGDAYRALRTLLVDRFPEEARRDPLIARHFAEGDPAADAFASLLAHDRGAEERAARLAALRGRLAAIALEGDVVAPPDGVRRTLLPAGLPVETLVPAYAARHEAPFPREGEDPAAVQTAFDALFARAAEFLA